MEPIVIKRYGNRKHYMNGHYTTIGEIEALLVGGIRFKVIDHDTGTDITIETIGKVLSYSSSPLLDSLVGVIFTQMESLRINTTIDEVTPVAANSNQ